VPRHAIESIAVDRGITLEDQATSEVMKSKDFKLAKADVFWWVSTAPNVSENGISFDLLYSDRERMREKANVIYKEYDDPNYLDDGKPEYGYKGDSL
jgi:hypothetical protein